MYLAIVSVLVTGDAPSAIGQFFSSSSAKVPEVFAKVNSSQFPSSCRIAHVAPRL